MANIKDVIRTYQARCEQALLQAKPESAESRAYAPLLEVFKQYQSANPMDLLTALVTATTHEALPLAPRELHVKAQQAQQIAQTFVTKFQDAAGMGGISFNIISR